MDLRGNITKVGGFVRRPTVGFFEFIRKQGVVGLAIGFILGGSVNQVVSALVSDIISPLLAIPLGSIDNLKSSYWRLGSAKIMWGDFTSVLINFLIMAAVVYFVFKGLKLDLLDLPKEDTKK